MCAQLTRDLFAIAKFLFIYIGYYHSIGLLLRISLLYSSLVKSTLHYVLYLPVGLILRFGLVVTRWSRSM